MLRIETAKKILFIRLSSLGDILLTTPLIRSLKKQNPGAVIDYVARSEYQDVLSHNPHVNSLLIYKKDDAVIAALKSKIVSDQYDLIVDLQNNIRSRFLLNGVKSPVIKFHKNVFAKFLLVRLKLNFLNKEVQIPGRYSRCIPGLKLDEGGLDLFLPAHTNPSVAAAQNYIGFCPGSRHYTKMWPYDYYIELGEQLTLNGFRILLFGGKSEKQLCELIAKSIPNAMNLCSDNDLYQTAADMSLCKAIVSNDSGLMHVAAAMQVPTVAIFGSSVRQFGFTPYRNKHIIIENTLAKCRPCSHYGKENCPRAHFECMLRITPTMVYQNLVTFLSQR